MKNLSKYACLLVLGLIATWAIAEENEREPDREQIIEDEFAAMDSDGDGKVSRREYVAHTVKGLRENQRLEQSRTSPTDAEELRKAISERFDVVDTNSDDMWTIEEISEARQASSDESNMNRERMFEALDADDDEEVSLEEFTDGFMRRLQGRMSRAEGADTAGQASNESLKQRLEKRFNGADKNSDGVLTADELR